MGLQLFNAAFILVFVSVESSWATRSDDRNIHSPHSQTVDGLTDLAESRHRRATDSKDVKFPVHESRYPNEEGLQRKILSPKQSPLINHLDFSEDGDNVRDNNGNGRLFVDEAVSHPRRQKIIHGRKTANSDRKHAPHRPHVIVRRDPQQQGSPYPLNNGPPPPVQSQSLPPLVPNEEPKTSAPSDNDTATPRPTSDGSSFGTSCICLLLCLIVSIFLHLK